MDRLLNVKIPTFIINGYLTLNALVLWVEGFLVFGFGVLLHIVLKDFFVDKTGLDEVGSFCYFLCCTGIALIAASFLTDYVLFNQSIGSFGFLAMIYALLIIFQVLFCMAGFYYTDKLQNTLRLAVSTTMANYNANNKINAMLNSFQTLFRCCGSTSHASWFFTGWAKGRPRVPESCCRSVEFCHNKEPLVEEDIYPMGCNLRIDFMARSMHAGVLGLLLLNIITALCSIAAAVTMSLRFKQLRELNSVLPIIQRPEALVADGIQRNIFTG